MKKFFAILMVVSLVVLSFSGCSKGKESENTGKEVKESKEEGKQEDNKSESSEKVKIKIAAWSGSDVGDVLCAIAKSYNESQDKVEVVVDILPNDGYVEQQRVLIAADTDYDIMNIKGTAQYSEYAANNRFIDLTDRIKEQKDLDTSKFGSLWTSVALDGKYYGLPFKTTNWQLFYNKDLFDGAGLEYPIGITWDEYLDIASKLKDFYKDKKGPNGETIWGGFMVAWTCVFSAIQKGTYVTSDDVSALSETLELLHNMWTSGSHPDYETTSTAALDHKAEFVNGNVGMEPQGDFFLSHIKKLMKENNVKINWAVAPMPIPEGATPGTTWGSYAYTAILASSKHPDEAFDFLKYYCGEPGAKISAKMGQLPAYSTDETTNAYKESTGDDSVSYFLNTNVMPEQLADPNFNQVLNLFKEQASLYFAGETSIEDVLKTFKEERKSIQ